jgi:hypothetical protein
MIRKKPKKIYKTIREWLEELPDPYRQKAIDNCRPGTLNSQSAAEAFEDDLVDLGWERNLASVLKYAFVWADSREGKQYWRDVVARIESGELQSI